MPNNKRQLSRGNGTDGSHSLSDDEMALRVWSSKFRHTFGTPAKRDLCYEGVKISRNAHDGNFCAVNPKYLAVVTDSAGGGTFTIIPLDKTGRVDGQVPKVAGHTGPVMELKWNPFDDSIIASASDDATVKIWSIPEDGLKTSLVNPEVNLVGHGRRVAYLDWHPTASDILLSSSYDHQCIVWNVETGQDVSTIDVYDDTIYSVSWNRDGSLFASTCRDRQIRIIDPRQHSVAQEGTGHSSSKSSRVVFCSSSYNLVTTGFSKICERQCAVWDTRNLKESLKMESIDSSSGLLVPIYDPDTNVVFLAGKGDGNIRYYEVSDSPPYLYFLGNYQSSSPQKCLGVMPKRALDVWKCEVARFYKLHAVNNLCEPISFIVPRKSEAFQDNLFPPTASSVASLTASEWLAGNNKEPVLMSLKDGRIVNDPMKTFSLPIQPQRSMAQKHDKVITEPPVVHTRPSRVPASLKNIYHLSSNAETKDSSWNLPETARTLPDTPDVVTSHPVPENRLEKSTKAVLSPSALEVTLADTNGEKNHSSSPEANTVLLEELRRAYSEKLDVIKSLEERLRLKDRRIRQLEEHLEYLQSSGGTQ